MWPRVLCVRLASAFLARKISCQVAQSRKGVFEKVLTQTVIRDKRQMGRKWGRIVTFGAEPYVCGLKDMTELFLVLCYSDI